MPSLSVVKKRTECGGVVRKRIDWGEKSGVEEKTIKGWREEWSGEEMSGVKW